jgi:hypothetical protein
LMALDQHREPEVWSDVYTALADESGRLVRIRPVRSSLRASGPLLIANLARYLVDPYQTWPQWLDESAIRLIDLGRGATVRGRGRGPRSRGPSSYSAYDRREMAGLMQQQLGYGPGPRVYQRQRTRRGRTSDP